MSWLKSEDLLKEIIFNIEHKDLIKAKIVMDHIDFIDNKTQKRIMYELSKSDPDFVIPLVAYLLWNNKNYINRFPNIKDVLFEQILLKPDLLINLIKTESKEREVYFQLAAELQFEESVPVLLDVLETCENQSEKITLIECLGELEDPESVNRLANYLYSNDKKLVFATINALGKIGSQSSMQMLANRIGKEESVDLLILGVFARNQDKISIEKLNDAVQSFSPVLRNFAKSKLLEMGKKTVPILIDNLLSDDPNTLIHTLNLIGEIGDDCALAAIRKVLNEKSNDANVRFAAYEAIGMLPGKKGSFVLIDGITDSESNVRIAAAKAIDTKYDKIIGMGLRNILNSKDVESKMLVKLFIDAQTENIFLDLINDEYFQNIAVDYISMETHEEISDFYKKLLEKNNQSDIINKINKKSSTKKGGKKHIVCAVDDSNLILKIYRSVLHKLDFEPVLFQYPEEAVEWILKEKPEIICTDLNMPKMTGIELITHVRKKYSKDELPIVMVTTQDDKPDIDLAYSAGANDVMNKPFEAKSLGKYLHKYLKNYE